MPFLYVSPLLLGGLLGLILAIYITRHLRTLGVPALLILTLAAALWSVAYAFEILAQGLETKILWAKVQYLGIAPLPLFWFAFSIYRLGVSGWLRRAIKYRLFLLILPITTCILVFTNELHHLVWREISLVQLAPLQILDLVYGPYFWINIGLSYILLLWGSIRMVLGFLSSFYSHRWQILLALLAAVIPWIANLLYIFDINPIPGLDWTPFSFVLAAFLLTISLLRFHLIDILPIAQQKVFDELPDSLLVLDASERIISLNPAARSLLRAASSDLSPSSMRNAGQPVSTITRLQGRQLTRLDHPLGDWVQEAGCTKEACVEVSLGEGEKRQYYELHIKPISGSTSQPIGCLILLHDITVHKQDQAALEQARALLEATVAARTASLEQALERMENELEQRTLAEKRFADVVESAPDALLLVDQSGKILLVNTQAERLFGYNRHDLYGQHIINTLAPARERARQRRQLKRYIDRPSGRYSSSGLDLFARRKDGSEFPIEISLSTLDTADGFWLVFNVRDITHRVQAEEARQQLLEQVSQSHDQLKALTARLQNVQEIERRQLADELHDRVGQYLTGLNLNLQFVRNQFDPETDAALCSRLDDSIRLLEETTRHIRGVMAELHPPMLDQYGLVAALRWYCDIFSRQSGISTSLEGENLSPRLPLEVEMALFRLVQESLNNVVKHAKAKNVRIRIENMSKTATLSVEDDGQGFDLQHSDSSSNAPRWGLLTMQQRAASIGGELSVSSTPGQGTRVSVKVRRQHDED
nr:PAS domain S-box protein [Anaerolineae bacterium]